MVSMIHWRWVTMSVLTQGCPPHPMPQLTTPANLPPHTRGPLSMVTLSLDRTISSTPTLHRPTCSQNMVRRPQLLQSRRRPQRCQGSLNTQRTSITSSSSWSQQCYSVTDSDALLPVHDGGWQLLEPPAHVGHCAKERTPACCDTLRPGGWGRKSQSRDLVNTFSLFWDTEVNLML